MNRHIFHMKGAIYSKYKVDWKKVLKAYEMQWKGNMETWIWEGEGEKLVAVFDRDMTQGDHGVTLDAFLMWESEHVETDFKEAFIDFWGKIDGTNTIDKMPEEKRMEKTDDELEKWITKERSRIERMRTEKSPHTGKPAPEGFIKAAERDLEEKIREKRAAMSEITNDKKDEEKKKTVDPGFF